MQSPQSQQLTIRKILWFAFINAIVMYNLIIFLTLGNTKTAHRIVRELSLNDPMIVGICIAGALVCLGSLILARYPLSASAQDYPKFIIRMALSEVPAVLGLMLAFTTLQPEPLWVASAVSIALLILHRPTTSETV